MHSMKLHKKQRDNISLYTRAGERLYLNRSERERFLAQAMQEDLGKRLLCLILFYTGCRLSEALNLNRKHIQVSEGIISIVTLKRRGTLDVRELLVPKQVIKDIEAMLETHNQQQLFAYSRTTAWRIVKEVMDKAGICGKQASPKGLRHSFGVVAVMRLIALSVIQKWMGHASIETTQIYTQVMGPEERQLFERMWG